MTKTRVPGRSVKKLSLFPLPTQAGSGPGDRCGMSRMFLGSPEPDPAPNRHRAPATRFCRSVLGTVVVMLAAGCATGQAARAPGPKLSERTHLVGHGESMEGAEQAKARARADVCAQVRSQVESVLVVEGTAGGGQDSDRIKETVRQTCEFRHNELIHVDPNVECDDGRCRATAYMVRTEAGAVLLEEYRRGAAGFRASTAEALAATDDPARFTTAFRRASDEWSQALEPLSFELRVIAGGVMPEMRDDAQRAQDLEAARDRLLSSIRIDVNLTRLPAADRDSLGNALVSALSALGLTAATGTGCTGTLSLDPAATITCDRGYFGPQCKLALSGTLEKCSDGRELSPLAATFTGAHPRDESSARRQATSQAAGAALESALREQLGAVLPVR